MLEDIAISISKEHRNGGIALYDAKKEVDVGGGRRIVGQCSGRYDFFRRVGPYLHAFSLYNRQITYKAVGEVQKESHHSRRGYEESDFAIPAHIVDIGHGEG